MDLVKTKYKTKNVNHITEYIKEETCEKLQTLTYHVPKCIVQLFARLFYLNKNLSMQNKHG